MIPEWGGGGNFAIDRVRARIKIRMERAENGPWRRCITAPRTKEKQMTNHAIPEEAIAAATKSIIASLRALELGWVDTDMPDGVTIDVRDFDLTAAMRAALEAAAPIILSHEADRARLERIESPWGNR